MQTPRILISGSLGGFARYEAAVYQAGGEPLSHHCPTTDIPCDGLILAGGGDIDPDLLGEPDRGAREIDKARDGAELALAQVFSARKIPILGICRGHQVVNVALKGRLTQDIGPELEAFHSPESYGSREDLWHAIHMAKGSRMEGIYGPFAVVNSWHHQAVLQPGEGMRATAWSESGLIEAAEHESLPIWTVQFHPERMKKTAEFPALGDGAGLFTWLIEACRARMAW